MPRFRHGWRDKAETGLPPLGHSLTPIRNSSVRIPYSRASRAPGWRSRWCLFARFMRRARPAQESCSRRPRPPTPSPNRTPLLSCGRTISTGCCSPRNRTPIRTSSSATSPPMRPAPRRRHRPETHASLAPRAAAAAIDRLAARRRSASARWRAATLVFSGLCCVARARATQRVCPRPLRAGLPPRSRRAERARPIKCGGAGHLPPGPLVQGHAPGRRGRSHPVSLQAARCCVRLAWGARCWQLGLRADSPAGPGLPGRPGVGVGPGRGLWRRAGAGAGPRHPVSTLCPASLSARGAGARWSSARRNKR